MCGIAGYIGKSNASEKIIDMLRGLTYRGYDSCGIATVDNGFLLVNKKVGAIDDGNLLGLSGNVGIGHTRWATHGPVCEVNAHPHVDCGNKIAVVHNGTLDNYLILRSSLEGRGHVFKSDTDTEVIPHLLEEMPLGEAVKLLEGTYALLVLRAGSNEIEVVASSCPLIIAKSEDGVFIASDSSVLPVGRQRYIEDGEVLIVTSDIDILEVESNYISTVSTQEGFEHFMLKEIYEQPRTILKTVISISDTILMQAAMDLLRSESTVFVASGTSRYATILGRYILSNVMQRLGEVIVSSEFQYFINSMKCGVSVVAVSQSGETADIIHGVKQAKSKGAQIIAITNNQNSMLGRMADSIIPINCGKEIGVAASKTFTSEMVAFYLLEGTINKKVNSTRDILISVADAVNSILINHANKIKEVAAKISKSNDFYYLGRGMNFAIAGESALKLKEISYIHAEGMSAGELKHGTLALITEGTPVCGICPDDYTYQETILNLTEVKARKGYTIGISDKDNPVFDDLIQIPKVPENYYPMVCVVVAQLLAYWTAIFKGLNPDRPRNLAKSVTVR